MVSAFATRLLHIDSRITMVKIARWNDIRRRNVSLAFVSSSSAAVTGCLILLLEGSGYSREKKLLHYTAQTALSGTSRKPPEHHRCAPIRLRIISVHESGRRQVASHTRVIRL